jgi:hypothetical protein
LRHYGVDYDKPGTISTCALCNNSMSDPAVSLICVDCGSDSLGDSVGKQSWYSYGLLPDGIAALRAGRLPHRELLPRSDSQQVALTTRDFRLLVQQLLPICKRFGRPLTALRLRIDRPALTQALGPDRAKEACEFVQEIVAQGLRASDFTAVVADGVIACLPETSGEGARVIIEAVRKRLGEAFAIPLKIDFTVYELDNVDALLESLS